MPHFSTRQVVVLLMSVFLSCSYRGNRPFFSLQYADGQAITHEVPPETMTVITRTTTPRPRKPPKTRSSHPVLPQPDEDQIVLNPVRFGHFLHPAGEPIFLEEEGFGDSPSLSYDRSSSSLPKDLPGPVASTSPEDPSAIPGAMPSSEPEQDVHTHSAKEPGQGSLSSEAPLVGHKHLPRPPVSGHVSFLHEGEFESLAHTEGGGPARSSQEDDEGKRNIPVSINETRSETRTSADGRSGGVLLSDGESGRVAADQGIDVSSLSPQSQGERKKLQNDRADTKRETDDIFIDDPIFGDEKTYNSAGELIAIGNTKVEKRSQERKRKEEESGETTRRDNPDQIEDTAGPLPPSPNLGSPLSALDRIIRAGFSDLSATRG